MNVKQKDSQYISHTYGRFDLVAVQGKNATCKDENGKQYIDFTAGIGVNCLGFCCDEWADAVSRQAHNLQHISNLYYTAPMAEVAQTLCERTFAHKVFFGNSGAEANEGMIKAARKYSSDKYGAHRYNIISLQNSFHGRTIATLSATGQDVFHQHFGPFVDGFLFTPANDMPALQALADDSVCGIMLELIQGEGGVVPLEKEFVQAVADLCRRRDILLMIDEVQTGVGRTGKFLCSEHYNVTPDICSLAKGLAGGLPIGAVLLGEKCADVFAPGDHGTTFGGNPISCAGAAVVLERVNEALMEQVRSKGEYMTRNILKLPHVVSVEGLGLMLGITLDEGLDSKSIAAACLENGLIILTAKKKLRILAPLTISHEEITKGLERLEATLSAL